MVITIISHNLFSSQLLIIVYVQLFQSQIYSILHAPLGYIPSWFSLLREGLKNTLGIPHLRHGCFNGLNKKIMNCPNIESFSAFETSNVFLSSFFNFFFLCQNELILL